MERNFKYLNEEYAKEKLLVFDDMQLDKKWNKLMETLFIEVDSIFFQDEKIYHNNVMKLV